MYRISAMGGPLLPLEEQVPPRGVWLWQRRAVGFVGGRVNIPPDTLRNVFERALVQQVDALQVGAERQEGIALADLFQLLARAVPLLLIITAVRSKAGN